jgi:Transmembrane secretion effector
MTARPTPRWNGAGTLSTTAPRAAGAYPADRASRVLGPAVGGVLLAVAGTAPCFLANALSYVPTLWVLARFRPLPPAIPRPAPRRAARVSEGLAEVMRSPEIRSCILIALAGSTVFNLSVAAPLFASRVLHLGGGGYGALMAAFGVGVLPGALAAASSPGEPSGRRIRALALLTGAAIVGTAYAPSVAAAFTGMALVGFLSIWLIAAANTLVQLRARPLSRGRIMGIWSMALPGAFPVTGLLTALVAAASARAGLAAAGIGMMIVAAATWTSLGRRAPQP